MKYIKSIPSSLAFLALSLLLCKLSNLIFYQIYYDSYPAHQQYLVSSFLSQNFFGQMPVFAIGILSCFIFENKNTLKRTVLICDCAFAFMVLLEFIVLLPHFGTHLLSNYIVFSGIFALGALNLAIFPVRLLVNGVITLIGEISFSMYLVHFAVIYGLSRSGFTSLFKLGDVSSLLYFLCVVAVTAAVSRFLYAAIETQGILFGKRLIGKLEASARSAQLLPSPDIPLHRDA